jgi:thioesterase DpgC
MAPAGMEAIVAELSMADAAAWLDVAPDATSNFSADRQEYGRFWTLSRQLLEGLPKKPTRSERQALAAATIHELARDARERFLRRHARAVYEELTQRFSRFVRVESLVLAAADAFPGLVPSRYDLAAEAGVLQGDKEGLEIDQGIFLSHILADEKAGTHLCHAMLLPRPEAQDIYRCTIRVS